MAAPKLRFKEFNDNWLKVDIQSLVDEKIIDKPMDGNHGEIHPTSADYVEDGIPFVMATDVIDGKVYLDKSKKIKKSQADGLRKGFSLEGDILLTHKATIGNVAKVPELKTPYIMLTPQVTYYRVLNKDKLNQDFIKSTFEAPVFQNALLALCTGATRLYIGISEQRKLPFSYPSKKEQTKIASFLSAVDEKISQLTQKHELLSQYKQGMMHKLFSQQLRFKADDGSEFGEWDKVPLGDCVDILTNGLSLDQNTNGDGFQVTRIETISNFNIDLNRVGYVDTQSDISSYKLVIGDILFSNINSISHIGKVVYVDKDYDIYHGMNLLRIQFKRNLDKKFMFYQLSQKKFKQHFETIANKAVNQASINQTALKKTELCTPCLEEQIKIATFLSAIDQKIEVVAQQLKQAKQWKKGLLQQMFV